MRKIGFESTAYKSENYAPAVIETIDTTEAPPTEAMSLEDTLKKIGWEKAQKLLFEYLFETGCTNQDRLKYQLIEIKKRFFAPI